MLLLLEYLQLLGFFRQYSRVKDWRHLKTLGWMVSALIGSGKLSLPAWEPHVTSKATQAQSFERRCRRFLMNDTNLSNQGDRCDRSRLEKKAAGEGLRDRADVDLSFFN